MFHSRNAVGLEAIIKQSGISKKKIAKSLNISPQWLSKLLSKDTEDLTVRQVKDILRVIGIDMSIVLEEILVPKDSPYTREEIMKMVAMSQQDNVYYEAHKIIGNT